MPIRALAFAVIVLAAAVARPASADSWVDVEGATPEYQKLAGSEIVLAGELKAIETPPASASPLRYRGATLAVNGREVRIVSPWMKLEPLFGQKVEVKCKASDGLAAEKTTTVRVGAARRQIVATSQPASQPERLVTAEDAKKAVIAFLLDSYKNVPNALKAEQINITKVEDGGDVWVVHFALNPRYPASRRVDKKTGQVLMEAPRL